MAFLGTLFPKQKEAANFLCVKKTALLAWEQGCGKTIISLAAAEKLLSLGEIKKVLILCPNSITWQWMERINEFTDSNGQVVDAKSRCRGTYETGTTYTITSWNLFRRDYEVIKGMDWDLIVADEAQEFKNNKSLTSKYIKSLQPRYRWALTGTAISNKLEELYSILYWVDKGFLPNWPTFEALHIIRNPWTNAIESYTGLGKLNKALPRRVDRKTQEDLAGQLPKLREQTYYVDKTKEIIEAESVLLKHLDELAIDLQTNGGEPRDPRVTSAFTDLRRKLYAPKRTTLLQHILRDINDNSEHNKSVIYSSFKQPLYELVDSTKGRLFTGDQDTMAKKDAIAAFRGSSTSVLLSSNAGAVGLDLPFANYCIHLDMPFSHGLLDQRNKRIVRASSKFETCVVIYLIVKDSIEEYYYGIVKNKAKLANAVYTGDADGITIKSESLRAFIQKNH